jgi:hypothetical protein
MVHTPSLRAAHDEEESSRNMRNHLVVVVTAVFIKGWGLTAVTSYHIDDDDECAYCIGREHTQYAQGKLGTAR